MKTNLIRTLVLAAVTLTGVAAAYAQINVVADVPFLFRAAGQDFDAGAYTVSQIGYSGAGILALNNRETGMTRFLTTYGPDDAGKDARPKMVFQCGEESGCALAGISLPNGRTLKIRVPHLKPSEMEHIAVVYMDRKQAE